MNVPEDRLFRVLYWEEKTKEDLPSKIMQEKREVCKTSPLRRQKIAGKLSSPISGQLKDLAFISE